ncbi:MAG: N-6 DNA methylase [Verrucomicrobia bacterium]|nr:N-6 DNA methylase [Verrucomicrobiota bacterium]
MIGQFFTPDIVARAMYRLARIKPGQRVIDPSCGDGVFLRCSPKDCKVFACEMDERYRLAVEAILPQHQLIFGDALTDTVPLWGTFDLVIGNPPFSAQAHLERRSSVLRGYDLGAGRPSQCLEVLFLELFLKLAKPRGRIAIILPDGPLSNVPFDYVRAWLLRHAHVETIVSLPRNTFSETTAKTNVLIAQKLPPSHQPYREPTFLRVCRELPELESLGLLRQKPSSENCTSVVLAEVGDWRAEAHPKTAGYHDEDTVRLGDVCRLRTGCALYGASRELYDRPAQNRILLLRAKNFAPGGGFRLTHDLAYVCKSGPMFRENALVQPGEILFVRVGAGCYGRTALVPPRLQAQADDWLHVLTPLAEIDAEGLVDWLNSSEGRTHIQRLAKGVGTLSVSKSSLAELRIPARFVGTALVLREDGQPYSAKATKIKQHRGRFVKQPRTGINEHPQKA